MRRTHWTAMLVMLTGSVVLGSQEAALACSICNEENRCTQVQNGIGFRNCEVGDECTTNVTTGAMKCGLVCAELGEECRRFTKEGSRQQPGALILTCSARVVPNGQPVLHDWHTPSNPPAAPLRSSSLKIAG